MKAAHFVLLLTCLVGVASRRMIPASTLEVGNETEAANTTAVVEMAVTESGGSMKNPVRSEELLRQTTAVVEFGGSQIKVVVYIGENFMIPDANVGPKKDGVLVVPGFSGKKPDCVKTKTENCKEPANLIKREHEAFLGIRKVIEDNRLYGAIVFFVSGGHIEQYPISKTPKCSVNSMTYKAKNCIPKEVETVRDALIEGLRSKLGVRRFAKCTHSCGHFLTKFSKVLPGQTCRCKTGECWIPGWKQVRKTETGQILQSESESGCVPKSRTLIPIEVDEAQFEGRSVIAGYNHVTGGSPALEYPVMILLGGSTSSQLVYIAKANSELVASTFIMVDTETHKDNKEEYRKLVSAKILKVMGGKKPKTVFFCSNFAFAIVRPEVMKGYPDFMTAYIEDEAARTKAVGKADKGFKPNQPEAIDQKFLDNIMTSSEFGKYSHVGTPTHANPKMRGTDDDKIWTTLKLLYELGKDTKGKTGYLTDKATKIHVFKELVKGADKIKAGASHGIAQQIAEAEKEG